MTIQRYRPVAALSGLVALAACQAVETHDADDLALGACNVRSHVELIGQPVAALDDLMHDGPVRVLGPTDVMTADYNPMRLTILLDGERRVIQEVRCG
jgi:hypothetical protein